MKSILYQLKKYRSKTDEKKAIELPEETDPNGVTATQLIENILSHHISINDKQVKRYASMLGDMPLTEHSDILYPLEFLAIYHLYWNYQVQIVSETRTDDMLKEFLAKQNIEQYSNGLHTITDDVAKKITLARVMIATYPTDDGIVIQRQGIGAKKIAGPKPASINRLPIEPFRRMAAAKLEVFSLKEAADLLETLQRDSTLEQKIMGRLYYLALWHWWQKPESAQIQNHLLLSGPESKPP